VYASFSPRITFLPQPTLLTNLCASRSLTRPISFHRSLGFPTTGNPAPHFALLRSHPANTPHQRFHPRAIGCRVGRWPPSLCCSPPSSSLSPGTVNLFRFRANFPRVAKGCTGPTIVLTALQIFPCSHVFHLTIQIHARAVSACTRAPSLPAALPTLLASLHFRLHRQLD